MNHTFIQILLLVLLILFNGFFSMTEIAIVSVRKPLLRHQSDRGDRRAKRALDMSEQPNLLLSTVQVGITLIGLLAGALGGSALSVTLADSALFAWAGSARQEIAFILVILLTTFFTIVVGELVPKRLGMHSPERIAKATAPVMDRISLLLKPLVKLLEASTTLLTRLFRLDEDADLSVSEEEIRSLVEEGARTGSIEHMEKMLMHQILDLGDLTAADIMTPKAQLVWLDSEDSDELNLSILMRERHSQYPVAKGGFETFLGIVSERDLLKAALQEEPICLTDMVYRPVYTAEPMEALTILELFRKTGCRETIVVDEYGDIAGLITRKDILEHIVGEMKEADEQDMLIRQQDGVLLANGLLPSTQLKRLMKRDSLPYEEEHEYHTLSGFMISYLGRIPHTGDQVDLPGWRLTIKEMDQGIRIKWVRIERTEHET